MTVKHMRTKRYAVSLYGSDDRMGGLQRVAWLLATGCSLCNRALVRSFGARTSRSMQSVSSSWSGRHAPDEASISHVAFFPACSPDGIPVYQPDSCSPRAPTARMPGSRSPWGRAGIPLRRRDAVGNHALLYEWPYATEEDSSRDGGDHALSHVGVESVENTPEPLALSHAFARLDEAFEVA